MFGIHVGTFILRFSNVKNRQRKANSWTLEGHEGEKRGENKMEKKKKKRLLSSYIVTEFFRAEEKRRHERLALLLQA